VLSLGVTTVCALIDGPPEGMAASSFTSVSVSVHTITPLLVHGLRAAPHTPPLIFHGSRFRRMAAV
jgi:flavin reductase (DIM6/NTAB) family NADH-FMN oxidoreductase RutF